MGYHEVNTKSMVMAVYLDYFSLVPGLMGGGGGGGGGGGRPSHHSLRIEQVKHGRWEFLQQLLLLVFLCAVHSSDAKRYTLSYVSHMQEFILIG